MSPRIFAGIALAVVSFAASPRAAAQSSEMPDHSMGRRWSVGGEIAMTGTPREDTGFFNNTDYDVNAMRLISLRVSGEWRVSRTLSFVGDLRSENAAHIVTPSAYVRWKPRAGGPFAVQAGRIPPVFGAFTRRPYGRDTLTLGEPLGYQYLTSLRPDALPATVDDIVRMRARGWQPNYPVGSTTVRGGVPLFSVSGWDTGVEATWSRSVVDVSGAVTRGSPAIPTVKDRNDGLMASGRVAVRGPAGFVVGASAARGQWVEISVLDLTVSGRQSPSSQSAMGADVEFGAGPLLVRLEFLRARFEVPVVLDGTSAILKASSGFIEGRYRFLPRWQLGVRLDRLDFSDLQSASGVTTWDAPVERVEAMLGFRMTRRIDLRVGWQQNWRKGGRVRHLGLPAVGAFYWF